MINLKLLALAVIFLLFCISFNVLRGGRTLIVKVELYRGTVASTLMVSSNFDFVEICIWFSDIYHFCVSV